MLFPSERYPMHNEFVVWDELIKTWTIERIEKMKLEEYTNLNREDSFTYWIESRTKSVIGIKGGSSYKFGIFLRNPDAETKDLKESQDSDGIYGWYKKYGLTPQEAFANIKKNILDVIYSAQNKQFEKIDSIDLGSAYKWKIAFMYAEPGTIPGIVSEKALHYLGQEHGCSLETTSGILKCLMSRKPVDMDFWEYTHVLWNEWENKEQNKRLYSKNKPEKNTKLFYMKNIILYGPPGVGKTHNHKKIVSLIENGQYSQKELFDAIVQNQPEENVDSTFDAIKKEGRVAFVTFHQSFSYEDFIEGYRPNEEGKIELADGVFKKLAEKANENLTASMQTEKLSFQDAMQEILGNRIENDENVKIPLKRENSFYTVVDFNDTTIFFEKQKGESNHSLSIKTLHQMYRNESVDEIKGGMKSYYDGILQQLLKVSRSTKKQVQEQKNYYLIIDEINRGNISKIFGELITLIEEDKRDSIEVTLPYSKELFNVPGNLYIIATMNSTDKSIALIDIALRRRFTFLKMQPNPTLVEPEARDLFGKLNVFIKEHLGEDFLIGHSYLMNYNDLGFEVEYKIKPLLEEYFFADPDKLQEALEIIGSEHS